jgi:hypothetical protein
MTSAFLLPFFVCFHEEQRAPTHICQVGSGFVSTAKGAEKENGAERRIRNEKSFRNHQFSHYMIGKVHRRTFLGDIIYKENSGRPRLWQKFQFISLDERRESKSFSIKETSAESFHSARPSLVFTFFDENESENESIIGAEQSRKGIIWFCH